MNNEEDNDIRSITSVFQAFRGNPYTLVVLISMLVGTGVTTGINSLTEHRPNPWTSLDEERERAIILARDENESRERKDTDRRLFEELQKLTQKFDRHYELEVARLTDLERYKQLVERAVKDIEELRRK